MQRREFIAGLAGAAAWPLAAGAQQDSRLRRVGVLMGLVQDEPEGQARMQAFRQGLADFGWVEGRNLHIDERWSGLDIQRQQSDARDLVALAPEVILTGMTTTTLALRNATQRIPIVFVSLRTRSSTALSRTLRGRKPMSPVSPVTNIRWPANG